MLGTLGQTLRSVYAGLFGPNTSSSTREKTNLKWDTSTNPDALHTEHNNPKNGNFSNPNLNRAYKNLDMELEILNQKMPSTVARDIKSSLQNRPIFIINSEAKNQELINELKQILRNTQDTQALRNQIKEISLKLGNIQIDNIFSELQNLSSQNITNKEIYKKVFNNYFHACYEIIKDVNKIVLEELLENENATSSDLIRVTQTLKEAGAAIAETFLNKYTDLIRFIPDLKLENQQTYKSLFIENYREDLRKLTVASNFGLIDPLLPSIIFNAKDLPNNLEESKLFSYLAFTGNMHEVTQGAVLIGGTNSKKIEISTLSTELGQKVLNQYLDSIVRNFELLYDDVPDTQQIGEIQLIENSKNNLRQYLQKFIRNELNVYKKTSELSKLKTLSDLDLSQSDETEIIKNIYSDSLQTYKILGLNTEKLPGYDTEQASLYTFLDKDNAKRHFERIVLETALLAGFDAIGTYSGWKTDTDALIKNYKNHNSIPWLEGFYNQRLKAMNELIKKETSEIDFANVLEYISHLGLELSKSTQSLYNSEDFFRRANIQPLAEKLLSYMTSKTRIGVMSLIILFLKSHFSTIFSQSSSRNLSPGEVNDIRELKHLIDFLEKEARVIDDKGDLIHAPKGKSPYINETYDRLSKTLSDTGFLLNNAHLIIKFVRKSIENVPKNKNDISHSLQSKNLALSVWLLYTLVKFQPEFSKNPHALRIKRDIFELMFDDKIRSRKAIPPVLYEKLRGQALGVNEDATILSTDKKGYFESLFNELDSRIEAYAKGKATNVPLKDLLYIYSDIDRIITNNPKSKKNILERFDQFKLKFLEGLDKAVTKVVDADLGLVVEFAKQHHDNNVSKALANALLDRANTLADILLGKVKLINEIELLDSDSANIHIFTKFLQYLHSLGFLMNQYNDNKLTLNPNSFISSVETYQANDFNKIKEKITKIEKVLNLKVNLRDDENFEANQEVFAGQYDAKRALVEELKKFESLKPSVGLIYKWRKQNEIDKLRERSLDPVIAV